MHKRRKVLNIGGGAGGGRGGGGGAMRGQGSEYWGPRGGGKLFDGCKQIGAPAPNQCKIITFLTLKTVNIAKLRIELKTMLLEMPSNKIKRYILLSWTFVI